MLSLLLAFCLFQVGPLHSPEDKESKDMVGTAQFMSTSICCTHFRKKNNNITDHS